MALGVEEMIRSFDDQQPIRGQITLCCGNGQLLDSYTNLDIEKYELLLRLVRYNWHHSQDRRTR